jgi:hypothetical protein
VSRAATIATRGLLGLAALLFAFFALPYFYFPFAGEHGFYSYDAWRMALGETIYKDFGCHDGPGIYLLHYLAHGLFGAAMSALRAFDLVWMLASLALVWSLVRRLFGAFPAALALVLCELAYFSLGYQPTAQRDGFTLLPLLLALRLDCAAPRTRAQEAVRDAAIGFLLACVFSIKPPLLATAAAFLIPGARRPDPSVSHSVGRLLRMGAGFLLPVLAWLAYFGSRSALPHAYECLIEYHLLYAGERYPFDVQAGFLLSTAIASPYLLGGLLGFLTAPWQRRLLPLRLATLLVGLVVVLQGKLLGYHLVPTRLLLALWCAAFVAFLVERGLRAKGARRVAVLAAGALLLLCIAAGALRPIEEARYASMWRTWQATGDVVARREESGVADYVAQHTTPEEPVLVWGEEAPGLVHFMSRRRAPTRFLTAYPFALRRPDTALTTRWREEYVRSLRADPPKLLVVLSGDEFPGINNLDSSEALLRFTALKRFVDENYRQVEVLRGRFQYTIYERRDASPEAVR